MTRLGAFALLAALTIGLTSNVPAAEEPSEAAGTPADSDIEIEEAAATVTGALQGKEGLRIQTLCTHCNSANIQVGGLAAELAPIFVNGYPVLSGLAASLVFSVLPPDTVADAQVAKGPGAATDPAPAAGGTIRLTESTSRELPRLDHTAEVGSYDRGRGTMRFSGPLASWASGTIVAGREKADAVDDDADGNNDVGAVNRDFVVTKLDFEVGRSHAVDVGFSYVDEENIDGRGGVDPVAIFVPDSGFPLWTREDTLLDRREYRAGWIWKLGQGRSLDVRLLADNRHQTVLSQLTRDPNVGPTFYLLLPRLTIREDNQSYSARYRHPVGLWGIVAAGVEAADQEVYALNEDPSPGSMPEEATDIVEMWSGFVDLNVKFGTRSDLEVGLRYEDLKWGARDYKPDIFSDPEPRYRSRGRALPRATFRFRPANGWTLKLIAGTTMRAPRPIFAEVCCGQRYRRNVDTLSETGTAVGFEGVYQPSPELRVSLYTARVEFDEFILRMVAESEFLIETYALANVDKTRADTLEMAVRWKPLQRLTLDGSIGWLSHKNRGEEQVLVVDEPGDAFDEFLPIGRIPYEPERTGSLSATLTLPGEVLVTAGASYTGSMLIQQYDADLFAPQAILLDLRATPGFWLANLGFRVPVTKGWEVVGGLDNITDELQDDLGDPTTDYNWGPLAGRSWRLGLRYSQQAF